MVWPRFPGGTLWAAAALANCTFSVLLCPRVLCPVSHVLCSHLAWPRTLLRALGLHGEHMLGSRAPAPRSPSGSLSCRPCPLGPALWAAPQPPLWSWKPAGAPLGQDASSLPRLSRGPAPSPRPCRHPPLPSSSLAPLAPKPSPQCRATWAPSWPGSSPGALEPTPALSPPCR